MTISPTTLPAATDLASTWPDDVADLTDRRRLLVQALFGVDVAPALVDGVFEQPVEPGAQPPASSGSTTMRSDGRSSSTVER